MTPGPLQRKLFVTCAEFGLDKHDRVELAEIILKRDVETWASLSDVEMQRMADALDGYRYVDHLVGMKIGAVA